MKLDQTDLKILEILQERGRVTNAQLATEIGLSPAPTLERVRKLEAGGFIQSFHALVDAERLGLSVLVFVEVKLDHSPTSNLIDKFAKQIEEIPEVMESYHITGEGDFLLKLYAMDIAHFQEILTTRLNKLEGVRSLSSRVVLGTTKKKMQLPIDEEMATNRARLSHYSSNGN